MNKFLNANESNWKQLFLSGPCPDAFLANRSSELREVPVFDAFAGTEQFRSSQMATLDLQGRYPMLSQSLLASVVHFFWQLRKQNYSPYPRVSVDDSRSGCATP